MSDLITKAKAALGSSSTPTTTRLSHTKGVESGEPRVNSDKCHQNACAVPSATACSVSNCASGVTDATTCPMSPGPHASHVMEGLNPHTHTEGARCNVPDKTIGCSTHGNRICSTNADQYSPKIMHKLDPMVDSNDDQSRCNLSPRMSYDGSGSPTYISQPSRMAAGHQSSATAGSNSCGSTNKPDPRVACDSSKPTSSLSGDKACRTTALAANAHQSSTTPGTGEVCQVACPHHSNLLNKLNPHGDSDRDGSKTLGDKATPKQMHKS